MMTAMLNVADDNKDDINDNNVDDSCVLAAVDDNKTTLITITTTLITTIPIVASWRASPIHPSHSSCPCWARLQALSSF